VSASWRRCCRSTLKRWAGLFTYAVISLGYIWAGNPFQLMVVRLIQGIAAGLVIPIAQAYVGDMSPEAEVGKWQGYFNAAFFSGFGFGPLMGGALTDHLGMSAAFFTMGSLNLLAFVMVLFFLPEAVSAKKGKPPRASFREIVRSRVMKGLLGFRLAFSMGRGAFAGFLPIFAGVSLSLSATRIGVLIAVNILVMAAFQPFGGRIADRVSRRVLVVAGGGANILFLGLIPWCTDFWSLLGVCLLGSLGGSVSIPAASAMIVEEGRKFGMGSTMAIFGVAFSTGMAIGPMLSGVIADLLDIRTVFYFGACMGVVGTGLFLRYTER
jgi:DHA1 family multidrug resistance protein-like MFS transporter